MLHNLSSYNVVLGSNSARRQQLLQEMGVTFTVLSPDADESFPETMASHEVAEYLAIKKAVSFTAFENNPLYITADTVVIHDNKILGKPNDADHAAKLLTQLSGSWHEVITGVCVKSKSQTISFSCATKVHFKSLTKNQISYYIKQHKPFDKAGSYGIQEWIGMVGINEIKGSYYNVMGLPTAMLFDVLNKI